MSTASEDAQIYTVITRTIREANRLFFGPLAPMPNEQGATRNRWEAIHAELTRAQDMLWHRHATKVTETGTPDFAAPHHNED